MANVASAVSLLLGNLSAGVRTGRIRPATLDWYRHFLGRLVAYSGDLDLSAVDTSNWPNTVHFLRATRRLFRFAGVPFPPLTIPAEGRRTRILTAPEFRALRRHAGPCRSILWFLSQTGARPGELRNLTWSQVFEDDRHLKLLEYKARSRRRDGQPPRIIPLSAAAAKLLAAWRKRGHPQPTVHVFCGRNGQPFSADALRIAVRRAAKRAGLEPTGAEERIVAYSLRHTWATKQARLGADVSLLADALGHSDLTTTRRYLHRQPSDIVAGLDRLRQPLTSCAAPSRAESDHRR